MSEASTAVSSPTSCPCTQPSSTSQNMLDVAAMFSGSNAALLLQEGDSTPRASDPPSTAPPSPDLKRPIDAISSVSQPSSNSSSGCEMSARERLRAGLLQRRQMSVAAAGSEGIVEEKRSGVTYQEVVAPVAKRQRVEPEAATFIASGIDSMPELESPCNVEDFLEQAAATQVELPRTLSAADNSLDAIQNVDQDGLLCWDLDWSNECAGDIKTEGPSEEGELQAAQGDEDWTESLCTMLGVQDE